MSNMTPTEKAFAEGVIEGTKMALNQLDGQGAVKPESVYGGPIAPELRNWIEKARKRLNSIDVGLLSVPE